MQLTLKDFTRNVSGSPGDHLVAQIQQIGEKKSTTDTTDVIIETSPEGGDIRISDGNQVVKIMLGSDQTVQRILQNDVDVGGHESP